MTRIRPAPPDPSGGTLLGAAHGVVRLERRSHLSLHSLHLLAVPATSSRPRYIIDGPP